MPAKKVKSKKSKIKISKAKKAAKKPVKKVEAQPVFSPQSALVKKYQSHKGDTGSTGVQIALLTDRIQELVKHLRRHPKDFDSKRGLLILVGKRRRLLNYLHKSEDKLYASMVQDLGLRK